MSYIDRNTKKARRSFLYLIVSMVIVYLYYGLPIVANVVFGYHIEVTLERVFHALPDLLSLSISLYASYRVYKNLVASQVESEKYPSYYYDRIEVFAGMFNTVFLYATIFGNVVHRVKDLVVFYKQGESEHFHSESKQMYVDVLLDLAFILFNAMSMSLVFDNINLKFRPRDMLKEFLYETKKCSIKFNSTTIESMDCNDQCYLHISPHALNLSSYCLHVFYHCFSSFISIMMVLFSLTTTKIDVRFLLVEFSLILLSSLFIVAVSLSNLLDCFSYMMHSTTPDHSADAIVDKITGLAIKGLLLVHDVHVWLLKPGFYQGSVHVLYENEKDYLKGERRLNDLFVANNINMVVQPEFKTPASVDKRKVTDDDVCDLDCETQLRTIQKSKKRGSAISSHDHCGHRKCCH